MNSYQFFVPRRTPNVHLIPSSNANDQNKSISDLPFSATQSLENLVTPSVQSLNFQVLLAPPSRVVHPLARLPHIERYNKHAHGNQWTLLGASVPQWPCSWSALPTNCYMFQFLLLLLLILVVDFNHPTGHVHSSCTKNITSIRFKINWNNFKSYLIGSSLIRYIFNPVRFLSQ